MMASMKDQKRACARAAAVGVLALSVLGGCGSGEGQPGADTDGSGGAATSGAGTGGRGSTQAGGGSGAMNGSGAHAAGTGGENAGHGGAQTNSGTGGSGTAGVPAHAMDGGVANDGGSDAGDGSGVHATGTLPPVNAAFDYQLGGAYAPPAGVQIVERDRSEQPAPGLYNICYINGFQIQPGEESMWNSQHPELVLRDGGGDPVVDEDWGETLIDLSTKDKRSAVAAVIGEWIAGCKDDGFDAIEIDNLDSYSRSSGLLTEENAVATVKLFADAAHAAGLPIAQKNSSELVARKSEMGTDFAIAEECNRYSECDVYTSGYADHVLVIEYRQSDFTSGCNAFPNLSIVLRDVDLTTPSDSEYVYDGC
jgi:hypothetical protein